jgi:hypothetical protein
MTNGPYPEPRQTLCIDFDGVIYPYSHGWADGVITESPVPGAIEALWSLREAGYAIVIHTTRCREPGQAGHIRAWLEDHGAPVIWKVTAEKVPALAYIDDRAVRFTNWDDIRKRFS